METNQIIDCKYSCYSLQKREAGDSVWSSLATRQSFFELLSYMKWRSEALRGMNDWNVLRVVRKQFINGQWIVVQEIWKSEIK